MKNKKTMNTNNEFEYYLIDRMNNSSYPLLEQDDDCTSYQHSKEYIENPEVMEFYLGDPVPRKPKMVDYHAMPYSIVSEKIYNVINSLKINGLQLIPSIITGKNGELYEDYWYIHIFNRYPAMDRKKSIYSWVESIQVANPIEKLFLNTKYLETIPIEDRLIFRLQENSTKQLYHKSVVDAIMDVNPEGLKFTIVKDWRL